MRNKKLVIFLGVVMFVLLNVTMVYADGIRAGKFEETTGSGEVYFRFYVDGSMAVCIGNGVYGKGRYSISGSRLTISFQQVSNAGSYLSNKTWVYTLDGDDSFSGNGQFWVRTGN
jgi:hypothetical protein